MRRRSDELGATLFALWGTRRSAVSPRPRRLRPAREQISRYRIGWGWDQIGDRGVRRISRV